MNGTNKEKEIVPPVTITVSPDENPPPVERKDSQDEAALSDDETEFLRCRKSGSRKASFFIGDDEHIAVTIVGPDNKEISPDDIVVAPDGGYGYVIVFAAFMTNFVIDGTIFSFGIILDEIIKTSGGRVQADKAAWIGSLLTGFYLMIGPLVSSLCNKVGFRGTGIAGSFVAALGFAMAWYFSGSDKDPNMTALFICYGIIGGIGFGLAYVPSIICVGFYFSKKRALATGIAICGSGIGTFVYAPLVAFLISQFGWQGSLLVQAMLILTCVVFAALYRPLTPKNSDKSPRTPDNSPVGTPLLMRMKRARELEKWDSVNSFASSADGFSNDPNRRSIPNNALLLNGGTTISMDDTKLKSEILYENARKASANSLPGMQVPSVKPKKLAIPPAGDAVTHQRTPSIKNRSFVGLPVTLKEIDEEGEASNEETGSEKENKDTVDEALPVLSPRRSIYLRRNSTLPGVSEAGSFGSRKNSGMTLVLSSSALKPVDEMTQSRILRVATSKSVLNKPLLRDDIFYGGSLNKIPEYKNNVDAVFSSVEWREPMPRAESNAFAELPPVEPMKKSKFLVLKKMLDFSLLKSPTFLILSISGAVTMLGFFVPFIYCKSIAMDSNLDANSATFLISIIGISNTVARIFCGALADRPFVNPLIINNSALTIGGIATICVPFLGSHALFIMYACLFGISVACFASLRSILLVELLGLSKLTNAFGLLCLFQGAAALVGSPLAGFLGVATGDYGATFYVAGSMMLLSGVMCYPIHYVNDWEKKRENRKLILKNELLRQTL